ncbi:hypothetical protein GEMRC1_007333 [Eukaryota sp. GEM-RC1]
MHGVELLTSEVTQMSSHDFDVVEGKPEDMKCFKPSIYKVFPLKTSETPGHIFIDTGALYRILIPNDDRFPSNSEARLHGNLEKYQHQYWSWIFRTSKKAFRQQGYSFNHSIRTNGISVSLSLIRNDLIGRNRLPSRNLIQRPVYHRCTSRITERVLYRLW